MTDISETLAAKSDQLTAMDLLDGPKVIKITGLKSVKGQDQPTTIRYEGDNGKPYKPCLTMRRVLVQVWGKGEENYVGRSLQLYMDPKVKYGGEDVGGIRISHMSHISSKLTVPVIASKGKGKAYEVKPLATPAQTRQEPQFDPLAWADALIDALPSYTTVEALKAAWNENDEANKRALKAADAERFQAVNKAVVARAGELSVDNE